MTPHDMEVDGQSAYEPTEAMSLDELFGHSSSQGDDAATPQAPAPAVATFMYAQVYELAGICDLLSGSAASNLVAEVRRVLAASAVRLRGEIAQRRADAILCVFTDPPDEPPTHAQRGLHAAIATVQQIAELALAVDAKLKDTPHPALAVSIGVHLGAGEVTRRNGNSNGNGDRMVRATGEGLEIARVLEKVGSDLRWSIVTSGATRIAAGQRVTHGAAGSLELPDGTFLDFTEVTGLVPRPGSTTPPNYFEELRDVIARNQRTLPGWVPGSMQATQFLVEGYRLLRKLGEGSNASVYLAQPDGGGPAHVLKVLRLEGPDGESNLQRFMQEYALLASIEHPNVARFYHQGFSVGAAYIAMEHFPCGELRSLLGRRLDPYVALYYLRQIASGLEAVHAAGIVHRDLKPENVLVRNDGIVALSDFGIAKHTGMLLTDTGAGDVVGTPYYLSPEQATGGRVDGRADLYSLGVMFFEMLAGEKPYHASSARELLRKHVEDPVPSLPAGLQWCEPLLARLMAKDPQDRFESAGQLLDELESVVSGTKD
ncbi:protein kinase domain-containing protein [Ramlibacter sp. MMS24-I3-19]|uniref:serine/threonine-protein kinase n=1 Tax=Ramlibacter sp. MMS24-I3-19 TaxID=3416606 RepID=UPI003CFEC890